MSFGCELMAATAELGPLCIGIDPHPGRVPELFGGDTPAGLEAWGRAIVEQAAGRVAAVKPQAGLFERHGPAGMAALQAVTRVARAAGLFVILDAKRGDIGSTAEGYARACLGPDAPFPAHCVTVNPYMGLDTLEPFIRRAEATASGVAVLTRTSNPGAADFQALESGGVPLYLHIARALAPAAARLRGDADWSSLMIVAGATAPAEARALRAALPDVPFLVPGYGAQGASAGDALAGFVPGPGGLGSGLGGRLDGRLGGGLVNASRAVTFPAAAAGARTQAAWADAIANAIAAARAELNAAAGAP